MEAHDRDVARISERVRHFSTKKQPFRLYHGHTNSTRTNARSRDNTVDTSGLNRVLSVNRDTKTALVEPNVPMDALVAATLKHGLVPPVVMELPSITAGGGFSGMAGESSSCRHGPFDSIVNSIEIVLADKNATVAHASRTEKPDLFWGAACAFGTIGIVTLLELQLRDATKYVELTHYPFSDFTSACDKIQAQVADPTVDLVDGIVFSPTSAVVCSGRYVDEIPATSTNIKPRHYLGRWDPWFYLDVEKRTEGGTKQITEYVPLEDYLFRWDRGGFWVARYAFRYFLTPFNRITRGILDTFMHAKVMYHALHKSGLSDQYIIQDVGVPYPKATQFHDWTRETFNIYPLWLCPILIRRPGSPEDTAHGLHADFADPDQTPEFLLNFGIWGPASTNWTEFVKQNRQLESKVQEFGGKKTLYAQNHYTKEEFWDGTYAGGKDSYNAIRTRYGADWLPSVYDKVGKVDEEARRREVEGSRMPSFLRGKRPWQGFYGVYKAWKGGDYLLQKKKNEKGQEEGGNDKVKGE